MANPRQLPLFDGRQTPGTWNERMLPGEYAVHYSSFDAPNTTPYCTIFSTISEAIDHASQQVSHRPSLRCTIYDHQGLIGPPLREIRGAEFKEPSAITARFRRWLGSILFFGGVGFIAYDWINDFRFSWPAMIGIRMIFPGLILLVTEAIILLYARRNGRSGSHADVVT